MASNFLQIIAVFRTNLAWGDIFKKGLTKFLIVIVRYKKNVTRNDLYRKEFKIYVNCVNLYALNVTVREFSVSSVSDNREYMPFSRCV